MPSLKRSHSLLCLPLICRRQNPAPMTAAQVAAQMAVEAANVQKSRCELPVGLRGHLGTIYVSQDFSCTVCLNTVSVCNTETV